MPLVVKLDLTAADFRQHPAMEFATPHWLLGAIYGRQLLKTKLRQMRPDLEVTSLRDRPEHEQLLEAMVDVLDLRDWPKPRMVSERLKAARLILRMTLEICGGREPPSWRPH
jgi:hypothetical protein